EPDPLVPVAARTAVRRVLAVPRRLGQHRRTQPRDPQSLGFERTDVPARHTRQWEPAFAIRGGDCVVVELVRSQGHDPKASTPAARAPLTLASCTLSTIFKPELCVIASIIKVTCTVMVPL